MTDDEYLAAFDRAACEHSNIVLYGHEIRPTGAASNYYIDPARFEKLSQEADVRGLEFRRLRDLCSWQVQFGGSAELQPVAHSPRRPDEIHFADFTGDGKADALRMVIQVDCSVDSRIGSADESSPGLSFEVRKMRIGNLRF